MATTVPTQPKASTTPTLTSHLPPNNVNSHVQNGADGHEMSNGPGAFPIAQLPAPRPTPPAALPAPVVGSAGSATPLHAGTPPMTAQPHLRTLGPPQLSPMQSAIGGRLPTTYNGRIAIVEPPGQGEQRSSNGANPPAFFASPGREYDRETKYNEDLSRLTHSVHQAVPAAVRLVVRNNWEKALLGTEFHQAFIVSTSSTFDLSSRVLARWLLVIWLEDNTARLRAACIAPAIQFFHRISLVVKVTNVWCDMCLISMSATLSPLPQIYLKCQLSFHSGSVPACANIVLVPLQQLFEFDRPSFSLNLTYHASLLRLSSRSRLRFSLILFSHSFRLILT